MKKVVRILLLMSVLSMTGCDFLRWVAGRPTSEQIEMKGQAIEALRLKRVNDSLAVIQERARAADLARQDSLLFAGALRDMGVNFSSVFRFGDPVTPLTDKYYIIVGVYRFRESLFRQETFLSSKGFSPFEIEFNGGEKAVVLSSAETLKETYSVINTARAAGACPDDAWVYVNGE